jgi:predicted DsbA family dithiol-disulfide isomerase
MQIGMDIGLRAVEIGEMLHSDAYAENVGEDIKMAQTIGISGVPFFVIDGKYGISGAQPTEVFVDGLQQAWREYEKATMHAHADDSGGSVCTPDGVCEIVNNN